MPSKRAKAQSKRANAKTDPKTGQREKAGAECSTILNIGTKRPSHPKGVMITITQMQGHANLERPLKLYTRDGGIMPPPSLLCQEPDLLLVVPI